MKRTKKPGATMTFQPGDIRVALDEEACVLDVALSNDVDISHSCGGMGSCGTCRVLVESELSLCSERTDIENEMALDRGFRPEERLSCQLKPRPGLVVRVPEPSIVSARKTNS